MIKTAFPLWRAMRRAAVIGALLAGPSCGAVAQSSPFAGASEAAIAQGMTPYMAIGDYPEDRGEVFMFFEFTCRFCQANWRAMTLWGGTLPKGFRFIDVPVIEDNPDSKAAAVAFYTVKGLAPARLEEFKARAYSAAQAGHGTASEYGSILKEMGFSGNAFGQYARSKEMARRIERALQLTKRYTVEVTPSFGVGGQYETNANFTNGDYALLARLLSGLVSRQIEQGKVRS